jgi:hypothetical protein
MLQRTCEALRASQRLRSRALLEEACRGAAAAKRSDDLAAENQVLRRELRAARSRASGVEAELREARRCIGALSSMSAQPAYYYHQTLYGL